MPQKPSTTEQTEEDDVQVMIDTISLTAHALGLSSHGQRQGKQYLFPPPWTILYEC